jgi:hypothetical protein
MANYRRGIPTPVVQEDDRFVKFSFKYLETDCNEFHVGKCSGEFLVALVRRLREYSSMPVDSFLDQENDHHRHIIDFRQTRFPHVNLEQLAYEESWQFQVAPWTDWRVYGILVQDTFFVMWLDTDHALYGASN